jgi:alpha-L-rhamnosidase
MPSGVDRVALLGAVLVACGAVAMMASIPPAAVTRLQEGGVRVRHIRTEYAQNPLGIDARTPRLSWQLRASTRDVRQQAYQIRVAHTGSGLADDEAMIWDTGRVESGQSHLIPYGGPALQSAQRYYWQVRVWTTAGGSDWSERAWWEMGLLEPAEWTASWIDPGLEEDSETPSPSPMLRREFSLTGEISKARLYATGHGLYELYLNGRRVGEDLFTPGWTSYHERLQYQTYDVASLLRSGGNALGAVLGDGWFRGYIGFRDQRNFYGERLALLAQLVVTFADGRTVTVTTDDTWKAATGPILMSDIYNGEIYDARLEKPGWSATGFDDSGWSPVEVVDHPKDVLVAQQGPPVRAIDQLRAVEILETPSGRTVVDFGQNLVGHVELRVRGEAGTTVTLQHGEVLDGEGNLYLDNLRAAKQTVEYTLKGGGTEVYSPTFTFQGFRYVAVDGYPGDVTLDSLKAIAVHSAMERTSRFSTSSPLVNQLQHNILWGQKGNFLDVPTDCPQRDERLGWTGDAQMFARTAAFNMDVARFFTKWLKDVAADQLDNGSVPHVIPDVLTTEKRAEAGSAAWADAAVIIPWTMYLTYGDRQILVEQYDSMAAWVGYMHERAGDDLVWAGDRHFGDWLAFATTRSDYPGATTGKDLIATAFFAHSTDLLSRAAGVLGRAADKARYERLFADIREAFVREFVTQAGRVGENTQTAYSLALHFDLLPEDLRTEAARRLVEDVREREHLTTGFVGTPYLLHVLTRFGHLDDAYDLLERDEYPSWLYPVTKGATTMWERWDGLKPDGSFQDEGMNSFNHYAYGAVGDWMYRVMAGIELDPDAPGYSHILIQPRPGGTFTEVSATHDSPYGQVSSAWYIAEGRFALTVEIPVNTRATIRLPGAGGETVTEGGTALGDAAGVGTVQTDGEDLRVEVGSGTYRFEYPWSSADEGASGL